MTRGARLAAAFAVFLVCVAAGTAVDEVPARPPVFRAGYRVLESDFHAHTRFSDGFVSPFDLVLQARRRGLDVLGITEHNTILPGELGRAFSRLIGGPTIVVGEEITTNRFHLIGVGLKERVHAGDPVGDNIDAIHAQGGVAIAAHPVARYWDRYATVLDKLDGAEVMHPLAFGNAGPSGWSWGEMRDFYLKAQKSGHTLTAIGSSDYHFFSYLGVTRTLVFAERNDEAAVVDALKKHRTVVYDLDHHAYGDPALIAALEEQPYVSEAPEYGYRPTGWLDRVTRLLGWAAVVALVALPKRDRR